MELFELFGVSSVHCDDSAAHDLVGYQSSHIQCELVEKGILLITVNVIISLHILILLKNMI